MRKLIEDAAQRALESVGAAHQPEPTTPPPDSPAVPEAQFRTEAGEREPPLADDFARDLHPGALAVDQATVSSLLFGRLTEQDVAAAERTLANVPELERSYADAPTAALRRFLLLTYGIWLDAPAVSQKTGLVRDQPPDAVHAMARGPLAAAGGLYEADLVVDALATAGMDIASVRNALDFGCSSGRVVRVLAAAYPETRWQACDPNEAAVAWAGENLPGIEFFLNDDAPPLSLADASLDMAYAISIWSHFAPELGLLWFEEMHRVIRPNGHLVMTTHGMASVGFYATRSLRSPQQSDEILGALYRRGWWYAPEFGDEGDWGVVNPDWGTAFLSPEWVLAQLCPQWRVVEFAPGRNQDNQDVYVLERV